MRGFKLKQIMTGNNMPMAAGRDWPLYGDKYGRMKFDNLPRVGIRLNKYINWICSLKYT